MQHPFDSRSGIRIERRTETLDYDAGLGFLVDRLDRERGAYFSSGVEDPTRYSRWDMGFVAPPLEFIARDRQLRVNALNGRGVALLALFAPILTDGAETRVASHDERSLCLEVPRTGEVFPEEERSRQPSVFSPLRRLIREFQGIEDGFLGLYGGFGYDLIFQFEQIPLSQDRSRHEKDLHLFLPDEIFVADRRKEMVLRYAYDFSRGETTTAGRGRDDFAPLPALAESRNDGAREIVSDHAPEDYMAKVEVAREHMRVGDLFELVLSRKFTTRYDGAPADLYRMMRRINPSPYEFFCQFGDEQLIGASPEMFVRIEGDRVESSPISGTVRRGANAMEDAQRIRELYNSEKDEVELTMCTDVDRNDKARICRPGSVRLLARRMIERYAGLFHTVDHVEGRLREGFDGLDAFLSHMWAVTLTGAPKRMAIRLVERMEASPRGWYGGAVGVALLNGSVNTGITIRTVHLKDGRADYRVGSSIVYDSIPAEEENETRVKSTAFFRAMADLGQEQRPAAEDTAAPFRGVRIVMIDNEDSFVHTLADYFRQTGAEVRTYRSGVPLQRLLDEAPDLVVHSPGPGRPEEFGMPELVRQLADRRIPQFGVCLGLQGMAEAFGGTLAILPVPRHGKTWTLRHDGTGLFVGVPSSCAVGAYHSLVAVRDTLPAELEVVAENEHGLVMAFRHLTLPIAAVQFHPESILSFGGDAGHRIVANVLGILLRRDGADNATARAAE